MGEENTIDVSFHGVRGSTPCSCPSMQRYGGNTSCVSIEGAGHDPVVFDMGTGLRPWGASMSPGDPVTVHALVTHLHWDHIQGLPFFTPLQADGTALHVYGPCDDGTSLADTFAKFMSPPYFPIEVADLPATVAFHDTHHDDFVIPGTEATEIMVRPVPHCGKTNGYRVTRNGVSVAYVPDHQEPVGRPEHVDPAVLDLCRDVDLLIHDAQFWPHEFEAKSTWGHCTPQYAVEVAAQAGAKTLVLFHHDPGHSDDELDDMTEYVAALAAARGVRSVLCATEGLKLSITADT